MRKKVVFILHLSINYSNVHGFDQMRCTFQRVNKNERTNFCNENHWTVFFRYVS